MRSISEAYDPVVMVMILLNYFQLLINSILQFSSAVSVQCLFVNNQYTCVSVSVSVYLSVHQNVCQYVFQYVSVYNM